jgi:hypothetical protein
MEREGMEATSTLGADIGVAGCIGGHGDRRLQLGAAV